VSSQPINGQRFELEGGGVAWWPCLIGKNTSVGIGTSIGALAHIGQHVTVGERCKIQGSAYIADHCNIGDDVFIGPNATLLNDRFPPSGNVDAWQPIDVGSHAVIGGNSTVVAGCNIGDNAVLAAGAVLTKDLPNGEVWAGNPASYLMKRSEYEAKREAKT